MALFLHVQHPLPHRQEISQTHSGTGLAIGPLLREHPCALSNPARPTEGPALDWARLVYTEMKRQYVDVFAPRSRATAHPPSTWRLIASEGSPRHPRLCCECFTTEHTKELSTSRRSARQQANQPKQIGARERSSPVVSLSANSGQCQDYCFLLSRTLATGPCRPNVNSTGSNRQTIAVLLQQPSQVAQTGSDWANGYLAKGRRIRGHWQGDKRCGLTSPKMRRKERKCGVRTGRRSKHNTL